VKVIKCLMVIVSLVTFASLFLPWWSIRVLDVSIDVYPFGVRALSFPAYARCVCFLRL